MDKFEMKAMETRFIMCIIGIGMVLGALIFDLGQFEVFFVGFGLTTLVLNLATIVYKMKGI